MGSGVSSSSTVRLRKAIVIRAYNLRKSDETLDEQFRPYAKRDYTNKLTITLGDVKKCLELDDGALWTSIEELFSHCMGISILTQAMAYKEFTDFIEDGKIPANNLPPSVTNDEMRSLGLSSNLPPSPPSKTIPNMHITSQSREKDNSGKMKENDSDQRQGKNENKMKRTIESKEESKSFRESDFNDSSQKGYSRSKNDEINTKSGRIDDSGSGRGDDYTINKDHPDKSINYVTRNASSGIDNDGNSDEIENYFITESPEENKDQIVTSSVGASRIVSKHNGMPVWKKKEVTKTERSVEYTTIDVEGNLQELYEIEVTETEILHMECRETGEFARRETTKFTQKETFNGEVVADVRGTEEYVHLKSLEDEIEFMDSDMPKKEQEQGREEGRGEREEEMRNREGIEKEIIDETSPPYGHFTKDENSQGIFDEERGSVRSSAMFSDLSHDVPIYKFSPEQNHRYDFGDSGDVETGIEKPSADFAPMLDSIPTKNNRDFDSENVRYSPPPEEFIRKADRNRIFDPPSPRFISPSISSSNNVRSEMKKSGIDDISDLDNYDVSPGEENRGLDFTKTFRLPCTLNASRKNTVNDGGVYALTESKTTGNHTPAWDANDID